jgi:hypothetical protein
MISLFSLELYTKECRQYQDDIGFYVQHCGGSFSVHRHDIEFTIPEKYKDFMLIQFPFLKEVPLIY